VAQAAVEQVDILLAGLGLHRRQLSEQVVQAQQLLVVLQMVPQVFMEWSLLAAVVVE
jgi:hypothetical protein